MSSKKTSAGQAPGWAQHKCSRMRQDSTKPYHAQAVPIIWLTVSSATVAVGFRCCRKSCQHFFPTRKKTSWAVALRSFFRRWGTILARSMLLCTIRLICLYLPVHRQSMCSEPIRCFPTGSFKHNASANGRLMPLQKRQINFPIRLSCNPSCPLLFH